jgi:hypothetical protein
VSQVHNERLKYLATLVNTVAAALITVGAVAPIVAVSYGVPGPIGGGFALLISLVWLSWGLASTTL